MAVTLMSTHVAAVELTLGDRLMRPGAMRCVLMMLAMIGRLYRLLANKLMGGLAGELTAAEVLNAE